MTICDPYLIHGEVESHRRAYKAPAMAVTTASAQGNEFTCGLARKSLTNPQKFNVRNHWRPTARRVLLAVLRANRPLFHHRFGFARDAVLLPA